MEKLLILFGLFRHGNAVFDAEKLHDKDKLVIALSAFLTFIGNALPKLFGIDLGWFTPELANQLAGGLVVVWLGVQHYISSPNRGILPAKPEPERTTDTPLP
jgi:hypothetical protein